MYKGVIISVSGSFLFGTLFYLVTMLNPLSGFEILGWRILFMWLILSIFMLAHKSDWKLAVEAARMVIKQPWRIPVMLVSAVLIGAQFWLFVWSPANGMAMDVSLGYFLFPLSLVLCGRILYKDKLSGFQKLAVVLASIGVVNQIYATGNFSWATLLVCVGYPPYFIMRRYFKNDNLGGFWWDLFILVPVSLWFIGSGPTLFSELFSNASLAGLLLLYGLISGVAMVLFILASHLLTMSLFGLLSYVEPMLLALVAFMLGESITQKEWITYIGIWLAVLMLMCDGARNVIAHHKLAAGKSGR
ncbi:EamA family transporter RarD [Desulfovibrio sp. OttesenSCG-928-C06]|nr:EamA family transporter RarD [Desulfovibrio sp. OttesenSCG-928-C06]